MDELELSSGLEVRGHGPYSTQAGRAWTVFSMPKKLRASRAGPSRIAGRNGLTRCGQRVCGQTRKQKPNLRNLLSDLETSNLLYDLEALVIPDQNPYSVTLHTFKSLFNKETEESFLIAFYVSE